MDDAVSVGDVDGGEPSLKSQASLEPWGTKQGRHKLKSGLSTNWTGSELNAQGDSKRPDQAQQ